MITTTYRVVTNDCRLFIRLALGVTCTSRHKFGRGLTYLFLSLRNAQMSSISKGTGSFWFNSARVEVKNRPKTVRPIKEDLTRAWSSEDLAIWKLNCNHTLVKSFVPSCTCDTPPNYIDKVQYALLWGAARWHLYLGNWVLVRERKRQKMERIWEYFSKKAIETMWDPEWRPTNIM